MLYEIDSFGFVYSYISGNYCVMSEEDILADRHLTKRLREAKYQRWKRHNVVDLIREYDMTVKDKPTFDNFCREIYRKTGET